ncbi:hypothetical protein [Streptomyces tremellae]|uniref:hypothetical protein n=1 Tax=Streptomyces tremellae TaxID=1124239 RepID=UPI0031E954F4
MPGRRAHAARLHATLFTAAAVVLYALLLGAWLTFAARTARASARGAIFLPPPTAP